MSIFPVISYYYDLLLFYLKEFCLGEKESSRLRFPELHQRGCRGQGRSRALRQYSEQTGRLAAWLCLVEVSNDDLNGPRIRMNPWIGSSEPRPESSFFQEDGSGFFSPPYPDPELILLIKFFFYGKSGWFRTRFSESWSGSVIAFLSVSLFYRKYNFSK